MLNCKLTYIAKASLCKLGIKKQTAKYLIINLHSMQWINLRKRVTRLADDRCSVLMVEWAQNL